MQERTYLYNERHCALEVLKSTEGATTNTGRRGVSTVDEGVSTEAEGSLDTDQSPTADRKRQDRVRETGGDSLL